ncbi:MAG: RNase adapter RapZ [Armatimonadetes bacterium]|nr:RNase adapter RapZ [Candidatus Hippobium faecium]
MKMKKLVIITGLSGSGKSLAATTCEDINFFVSDNITPQILPEMARLIAKSEHYDGFAAVIDWRCENNFDDLVSVYKNIKNHPIEGYDVPTILFLDCRKDELLRRFKETRRKHPLTNNEMGINEAIDKEKELFAPVLDIADVVYDTTKLEPEELRKKIRYQFGHNLSSHLLNITVSAFGFKYGMPLDPDLVFDVRFLKNPYWEPTLRNFSGRDQCVKDYIMSDEKTVKFMKKLFDLIDFCVPEYVKEGKAYLNIAIGCTGGRHRSIAVAEALTVHLRESGYIVRLECRDY